MPRETNAPRRTRTAAKAPTIAMLIDPHRAGLPLYAQLYQQLREHIVTGALPQGAAIPSARVLAADLRVSRNTVEAAISQLCAEGFLKRRVGSGTTVADLQDSAPFVDRPRSRAAPIRRPTASPIARDASNPTELSARGSRLLESGQREIAADRRNGPCTTDVSRFPTVVWNRLLSRVAREAGAAVLQGADLQGNRDLRTAVCEHARISRGLHCTPEQVMIVSSAQQAVDLASRVLCDPGDTVLFEEPGYRSARAAFAAAGATVVGVPVDDEGVRTEQLAQSAHARLLYLTPSHQFPLGHTLSLHRRLAALAWAHANSAWIIEDDYDSEFQYVGRPVAAMQGLDHAQRVLYVGTFNKVLFPGARLAYLVLPPSLVEPFCAARQLTDGGSPALAQAALAQFLEAGHFAAHLRRARRHYEQRRDYLVARLREHCGDTIAIGAHDTGLHLVAHVGAHIDDVAVADEAAGFGLGVAALSHYYLDAAVATRGLLLSYGAASDRAIDRAVSMFGRRLREARA